MNVHGARLGAALLFGALAVACGGDDTPDAGAASPDAGETPTPTDAGATPEDAGPADAGGPIDCGDCGAPTVCATPFCDEQTGICDPGYLTMDLPDDVTGDCRRPACTGTSTGATYVAEATDVPGMAEGVCAVPACEGATPGVAPAPPGTACAGQPGVCDGSSTEVDACQRCVDDEADPYTPDTGCTRERSFCYRAAGATRSGCFAANRWDERWGTATIGTDGLTVANLGDRTHARSAVSVSRGTFYWEIRATMGDEMTNGGGVGIFDDRMALTDDWIGSGASGFSFGYGNGTPRYFVGWPGVTLPSGGAPPEGAFIGTGKVYMFALDVDAGRLWVGHDGVWYNGGDPEMGLNPAAEGIPTRIFAGVTLYANGSAAFTANFMGPFQFPVPAGFRPGLF